MENQPIEATKPSAPTPTLETPPVATSTPKNKIWLAVLAAILVSGAMFGLGGYLLGKQFTTQIDSQPIGESMPEPTDTPAATAAPETPSATLEYTLPTGWKTIKDSSAKLEVGYDPEKYEIAPGDGRIELSGIWVGTQGVDLHRLGWTRSFYISSYSGGSRHTELYNILGITSDTKDWQAQNYSEKSISYSSWSCLIINGVNISQYPVSWGYCPISDTEAIVFGLDTSDWGEIEQQLATLKLLE